MKTEVQNLDSQYLWHPFAQAKTMPTPQVIQRAEGVYLYDEQGHKIIDLISSWWTNLWGHAHPKLLEALSTQAAQLDHCMFAGFTHEPAVSYAKALSSLLPSGLTRVFYSDNGSTATEVGMKMAYQYWKNRDQTHRPLYLHFKGSYHGDTLGAMSVGHSSGFHDVFTPFFFRTLEIDFPSTFEGDHEVEEKEKASLAQLDQHLNCHGQEICAMILEPLIQGAAGMRMCRPEFLQAVVQRLKEAGVLVIFDEVMTGFGRTGAFFACGKTKVEPDIVCLSKGITGGIMPFAATVCQGFIYEAFLGDTYSMAFSHGHSYMANPLACGVALASLALLSESQVQLDQITQWHQEGLELLKDSAISHIRQCGTVVAFHYCGEKSLNELRTGFLAAGLNIRPIGQEVYLIPPYVVSQEILMSSYQKVADLLHK